MFITRCKDTLIYVYYDESSANERNLIEHLSAVRFNELNDTALQKQSKFIKMISD